MNPKDFNWEESQQVTVVNPTSEDFKFKVHSMDYEVQAGKTAKMPGYMAWMYVDGMASKLCQADGNYNRWNEEGYRQTYYAKVVKAIDDILQTVEVEESEPIEVVEDAPKRRGPTPKAKNLV